MMVTINKVLDDAIQKQTKEESVMIWLGKLQHLACDVDFLLDEFQTEVFQMMLLGDGVDDAVDKSDDSTALSRVKEVNARLQDIAWQINFLGLKESSGGKSRNVGQRFPMTPSLILAAVRGGSRDRGPTIFSPLVEKEDLAFLKNEDCFDSLKKIGSDRWGEVYKAELPGSNGKMIAIRKFIIDAPMGAAELIKQDIDEYSDLHWKIGAIRSEIITASQTRHRNILPPLAHMVRPNCHLLVYEFMKNGSLQDILSDVSQGRRELDWPARHRIARGIASGLEYLHTYHRPRIIHGDIKPANVLVDDDMEARISDFGLAKLMPDGHAQITVKSMIGKPGFMLETPGYMPFEPFHFQTQTVSEKLDIYNFGVLLAVLVMGKFPRDDFFRITEEKDMVSRMRNVIFSENPNRAIDSKLLGNGYEEQMLLVLKLACFCTLEDPDERPNSKDVRSMLSDTELIKDFLKKHKRMDFDHPTRNL